MATRLSPEAAHDLDALWDFIAADSGNTDSADREIGSILRRMLVLAHHTYIGRARDADLGPGRRSLMAGRYAIIYRVAGPDALILRIVHGQRDLQAMFGLSDI